jgi:FAD/FMN-containing dehydrogenase
LIDQPSGLCLPHFFCAFDNCNPNPDEDETFLEALTGLLKPTGDPNPPGQTISDLDPRLKEWVDDVENPSYNLPSKVLFPAVANDVVAAVQFAKQHGLEISVKNSGHSYSGASTKKNTLHINMNKFKQYATDDGVFDCDESQDYGESTDLANQPCMLSLAKGKTALIRVGGGENWDKTYRAVKSANNEQEGGYKYHAVGGAAGTVSPMGWSFQGGLSGTTAGRIFGFGVDQVLLVR